jgi:hypothetical protein
MIKISAISNMIRRLRPNQSKPMPPFKYAGKT